MLNIIINMNLPKYESLARYPLQVFDWKRKKNRKTKKKKTKKRKKERRDIPYIMYIKNKYLHSLKKEKRIKENIKINLNI